MWLSSLKFQGLRKDDRAARICHKDHGDADTAENCAYSWVCSQRFEFRGLPVPSATMNRM